jgi:hypothetical protein
MTVLTIHEQQEIDRANTSGLQPVVFVHGLPKRYSQDWWCYQSK